MRLLFLFLTFSLFQAQAQSGEEEIKSTITRFFDGMRKADSNLIRSAVAPAAVLQTIVKNREGKTLVRSEEMNGFIQAVTKPHDKIYDERISFDVIRIDADLAVAWTPYRFYVGETFSHCGVNSFQLVKLDGEWKIQYIIDTRRKDNCL
jgi:hypothetical protein